jgi:uncharacterized damage-inducible protein DinB
MKRASLLLIATIVAAPALAQEMMPKAGSGALATMKGNLGFVQKYIVQAAEEEPEAEYAFKPTPEVRSLGQIFAHVADANYLICSTALGEDNPSPGVEKNKTAKVDIVAALKASYEYCGKAFSMSDEDTGREVELFGQKQTSLSALLLDITHNWEHYGNIVTYMRMNGHVPPSSRPSPQM